MAAAVERAAALVAEVAGQTVTAVVVQARSLFPPETLAVARHREQRSRLPKGAAQARWEFGRAMVRRRFRDRRDLPGLPDRHKSHDRSAARSAPCAASPESEVRLWCLFCSDPLRKSQFR